MTTELVHKAPRIVIRQTGVQGPPGPVTFTISAYQTWLDAGNEGTEQDFLEAIRGPRGFTGDDGENGDDGEPGQSAYDLAVELGFEGSQADWLESLKGEPGDAGEDGDDGENGEDGVSGFRNRFEYTADQDMLETHAHGWLIMSADVPETPLIYTIVDEDTLPIGCAVHIRAGGTSPVKVEVAAGSSTQLLHGATFEPQTLEQYCVITLVKENEGVWVLGGALKAIVLEEEG